MKPQIERRIHPLAELRVDETPATEGEAATAPVIRGYAAKFDSPSDPIAGIFVEKIAKGAFKKTLKEASVKALINHDPSLVMGSNTSGTLRLKEDQQGLAIELDPPDTTYARDLIAVMKRGDVDKMSFGFRVVKDKWDRPAQEGQLPTRTLQEVSLFDVSIVSYPAYSATEASVRSAEEIFATYVPEPEQPLHSEDVTPDPEPASPAQEAPETTEPRQPLHSRAYYEAVLATLVPDE